MTPAAIHRAIHRELAALLREGQIDAEQFAALSARYPRRGWDWHALGRWFLVLGAVTAAAGVVVLGRDLFEFTLEKLAVGLVVLTGALFGGGRALAPRRPALAWTRQSIELLGGFSLIGLTFTLGAIYSSGSGNWPALLLIDLVLLVTLSYGLRNVLLLVLSAVVFFTWFGGQTGYASGWGMYWFGMSYPLRFLLAAGAIVGVGLAHLSAERGALARFRGYYKVWLSTGLFFAEMALWLMALFGNFDLEAGWRRAGAGELLLFNVAWAGLNVALLYLGARYALRMLTGYGATFLVIHGYTLFFEHVAEALPPFLAFVIAGVSALGLAFHLERRRRAALVAAREQTES